MRWIFAFVTVMLMISMPLALGQEELMGEPVVVEGVVPNHEIKTDILRKLRDMYGDERVVDRVQVEPVTAPPNWSEYVSNMIVPRLRHVTEGALEVDGQSVYINGLIVNEIQRQQLASELSAASDTHYTVHNNLRIGGSGQHLLDSILANRVVEFETGSAVLTPVGRSILNEIFQALQEIGEARVQIVGHTDNVGSREANIELSRDRSLTVQDYLVGRGIPAGRISIDWKGPDEPVADNDNAEGRARNRRIEFRVL